MKEDIYSAGLFDGEGTVTIMKKNSTDKFKAPTVSMTSTTKALVDHMQTTYGGSIRTQKVYKAHHKQAWIWSLHYDHAITFLSKVLPYLKEPAKIRRAKSLVNEYKKITVRNGKYTEEQLKAKQKFEDDFFHPSTP